MMRPDGLGCLCLLLGTFACVANSSATADEIVHQDFVFEEVPFPECHASSIVETRDGIVVAWFGGTRESHRDVGIWLARRESDGWSEPLEVANGVQFANTDGTFHRHPCWNPVLWNTADDHLLLFYKCGPRPSQWWGMMMESPDCGRTWSNPVRLPEMIDGPVRNKPIRLDDGTLLCGSSTEYDGWTVHFELTRDAGKTWSRVGPINDGEQLGAIQPTLLTHPDGSIQALCRNQDGRGMIWSTTSTDQGLSWTPLAETTLPNPNSGIDGVTMQDGRHLLVYNHTHRRSEFPSGREMLNVAVSGNGTDWLAALTLEQEDGFEFSYPAVIQSSDGRIHITYTWKRQRIKYVVVDPAQLELRPIVNGKWPAE